MNRTEALPVQENPPKPHHLVVFRSQELADNPVPHLTDVFVHDMSCGEVDCAGESVIEAVDIDDEIPSEGLDVELGDYRLTHSGGSDWTLERTA